MRREDAGGSNLPLQQPQLRQLYEYWNGRRDGRPFPSRRDIDPVEFKYVLGHVALFDVFYAPTLRFRFRLHGTKLATYMSRDLTGRYVDELPEGMSRDYVLARCTRVIRDRSPLAVLSKCTINEARYRYEALWLPLSSDGAVIDVVMTALIYLDPFRDRDLLTEPRITALPPAVRRPPES